MIKRNLFFVPDAGHATVKYFNKFSSNGCVPQKRFLNHFFDSNSLKTRELVCCS